jgi:HEAT repeat protein
VLAQAGFGIDHPQIRKGVLALLQGRQPWGGWLDNSNYENFKTPFRETQFAVMALSQLFPDEDPARPRERTRGWQAGFPPPPTRLTPDKEWELLAQLDQFWERPSTNLLRQIGEAIDHPEPLVRKTAAETAGRLVAEEFWPKLVERLGDPCKVVRHSAAWAVRQYLNRSKGNADDLCAALANPRGTVKRGAIRVLTQHFSVLTRNEELGVRLTECLADPDPLVRLLAARGIWQWFWWSPDLKRRDLIVESLLDRLGKERHPDVLPAVREALYIVADENARYLYNNWIPLLARKETREKATAAQHAQMKWIGERVAQVLEQGDERQTENVLRALGEFHLRRGGYKNAGRYGRIGNDIETVQFFEESRDRLEPLLLRFMRHPNAAIREDAAVAAYTLRGSGSQELPMRWMELYADPSEAVRGVAAELQKSFPLPNGKLLPEPLKKLLASPFPEAKTVALSSLSRFPDLQRNAEVRQAIARALEAEDRALKRTALEAVLRMPAVANENAATTANRLLRSANPENRQLLFEIVRSNPPLAGNLEVVSVLSEALAAPQGEVRLEAMTVIQKYPVMARNPAVRLALTSLREDNNERTRQLADQLLQGKAGLAKAGDITKLLDYDYFVERVQPIFGRTGPDGQACATCHQTHTIFRLSRPGRDDSFSEEQSKLHYRSALKVVDLADPERSLILQKPLADARDEGVLDQKSLSHGGGIRWTGSEDSAYRTILAWINGAKGKKE